MQLTEEGAAAAVQAVVKKQHMKALELNENQISAQGIRQVKVSGNTGAAAAQPVMQGSCCPTLSSSCSWPLVAA